MKDRPIITAALALAFTLPLAVPTAAQQTDSITASVKRTHETVRGYITQAAEQFPEDQYGFQATKEVRTFGQLLGHIANGR